MIRKFLTLLFCAMFLLISCGFVTAFWSYALTDANLAVIMSTLSGMFIGIMTFLIGLALWPEKDDAIDRYIGRHRNK